MVTRKKRKKYIKYTTRFDDQFNNFRKIKKQSIMFINVYYFLLTLQHIFYEIHLLEIEM